jgi:hypothetical protein
VAELANALSGLAQGTGAWEIAQTADAVQCIESGHGPSEPHGPNTRTSAVAGAGHQYHLVP